MGERERRGLRPTDRTDPAAVTGWFVSAAAGVGEGAVVDVEAVRVRRAWNRIWKF